MPPSSRRAEFFHDLITGRRTGPTAAAQRGVLRLASVPYGGLMRLRNWGYSRGWLKHERAAVPVVSVGNLTLGGTGKTPCVEYLARRFRDRGVRVAILSRGYGSDRGRNDEALVLEENLPDVPHLQGADRAALARVAVEELESELLILDDGFQHRRLDRDLDIVLLDASAGPEQFRLFPGGTLREPLTGLRRASAVILTRCDQVEAAKLQRLRQTVERAAPGVPVLESVHAPLGWRAHGVDEDWPLASLDGRPVVAFCGIGHPAAFWRTLWQQGIMPVDMRAYPDHHPYPRETVAELCKWAKLYPADTVLATTQKDLVKLGTTQLEGRDLRALRVGMAFRGDGAGRLDALVDGVAAGA